MKSTFLIRVFFFSQDSRPALISALEDCVYTFLWLTAAACPLNSTQHDDCRVTNPATGDEPTPHPHKKKLNPPGPCWSVRSVSRFFFFSPPQGHLFDLNPLARDGGYTVYDHLENTKMFRMNICGGVPNVGCGPDAGTLHSLTLSAPLEWSRTRNLWLLLRSYMCTSRSYQLTAYIWPVTVRANRGLILKHWC